MCNNKYGIKMIQALKYEPAINKLIWKSDFGIQYAFV